MIPIVNDPPKSDYEGGASCDNFLTSHPQLLTRMQWSEQQAKWLAAGLSIEVTTSKAVADLKGEIEKLCSKTVCNQETLQLKSTLLVALHKVETTSKDALANTMR